jgi:hypothetical protein
VHEIISHNLIYTHASDRFPVILIDEYLRIHRVRQPGSRHDQTRTNLFTLTKNKRNTRQPKSMPTHPRLA